MKSLIIDARQRSRVLRDQRGITGLETAIVLIAFVVVASVFAFAILSSGLLATEQSKEAVLGGLAEAQATLVLRGAVITHNATSTQLVNRVAFQVSLPASGDDVNLASTALVVTYIDEDQTEALTFVADPDNNPGYGITYLLGTGDLLDPGERVEFTANLTGLTPRLGVSKDFVIQVKPPEGATLTVDRRTPAELTPVVNLN